MDQIKILVVDDEHTLCDVLKLNLNIEGYEVDIAYSAEEAMKFNLSQYHLIISDVMMDEINGLEFITKLHQDPETSSIPVILCTAKNDESDRVEGLLRGADDYICKPFSMKELILRVKNILRRAHHLSETGKIQVDGIIIDPILHKCIVDGNLIELTKKEFDLLYALLSHVGTILSREDILTNVWGYDVMVIDRSVDVVINRVRKKVTPYSNHIVTKHGYGYGYINSK